jgi:hypothetical protein
MHKGDIASSYRNMSAEDQRTFNRWLKVNMVVSSIFAAGLLAMALAGSDALGPRSAVAESTEFDIVRPADRIKSAHELMSIAPYRLPVEQVDEPF